MAQGRLVSDEKIDALLNPRNVVIVGATDKPGNWPQRVWRNLKRFEYPKPIYPFNPSRDKVWDTRCYRTFAELPEPPDHLVVLAPAKAVAGILRDAAAAGARSATIMTSGFEEAHDEQGRRLGAELRAVIAETGIAISGPNCLGNFNAAASFFSLPDDRAQSLTRGPVAVVGQSGGIAMAIKRTLEERGVFTDALVTSGNETGLTTADYISYFASQPQIKVIACYLEAVHHTNAFLAALRSARAAGKHVVVMKLGGSDAGRAAAAAHTGALAGTMEAFDAVAGRAGALRVRNLDEVIEAVEFLVHAPLPRGRRLGSITFSGGMRGLAARRRRSQRHELSAAVGGDAPQALRNPVGRLDYRQPLGRRFCRTEQQRSLSPLCRDFARRRRDRHLVVAGGTAACAGQRAKGAQPPRRQRACGQGQQAHRLRQHGFLRSQ